MRMVQTWQSRSIIPMVGVVFCAAVVGAVLNGWLWWWLIVPAVSVWVGIVTTSTSPAQSFWHGYVFGCTKMLLVLSWVFAVYPLRWLGDFSIEVVTVLIIFYWLYAASVIGLAFGLGAIAVWYARRLCIAPVVIAGVLTVSEVIGSVFFSVAFAGPGSFVQAYFSFGYVGYALAAWSGTLVLAQYFGVYGMSFLVYLIAALPWWWVQLPRRRIAAVGCITIIVGGLSLAAGFQTTVDDRGSALIIDTNITSESLRTSDGYERKQRIVREAVLRALQEPDAHILLPEDSRFIEQFGTPTVALAWWQQMASSSRRWLYDSGRVPQAAGVVLRGSVLESMSSTTEPYIFDKRYLVPQGEFLPYFVTPLLYFMSEETQQYLRQRFSYLPSATTKYAADNTIASYLFCFEAVNPLGVRQALQRHRADFIVHTVSHAWFTPSPAHLRHQLLAMLRTQAVWNHVAIVVAGNQFSGFGIAADGSFLLPTEIANGAGWSLRRVAW